MMFTIILLAVAAVTALCTFILNRFKNIRLDEDVIPVLWTMAGMLVFFAIAGEIF